jgi:leader peptidase (prepilin peptidase)/N-methyltransferase
LVETLNAILFALFFYRFGAQAMTLVFWLLAATLLVISFIDLDHQIIPDVISLPGILVGFLCSFAIPWVSWQSSLLGILFGGGSLLLIALAYEFMTKQEGMGFGDVKLLAMLGAFLGWTSIFPIIFLGSILGTAVGIPLMLGNKAGRKLAIPFGPFLAGGALIYVYFISFWYPRMHWYGEIFKDFWTSLFS